MAAELLTAIMRQSWYESARKRLSDYQRLKLYEIIYDFEFYGIEPSLLSEEDKVISIVFDLVKFDLQKDREKSLSIRERNRRNGQLGGRPKVEKNPKPNETQQNPNNPVGYNIHSTLIHNTSIDEQDRIKEVYQKFGKGESTQPTETEKWRIKLLFFGMGCQNALYEYERFYTYYAASDFRDKSGKPIKDFFKLALKWNPKEPNEKLAQERASYYALLKACEMTEDVFFTQFQSWETSLTAENKIFRLTQKTTNEIANLLETKYLEQIKAYLRTQTDAQHPFKLYYQISSRQTQL